MDNNNNDDDDGGGKKQPQEGFFQRISSKIEMAQKGYEQLVHAIIRPPRATYPPSALGPSHFSFLQERFVRTDVVLPTLHPHEHHVVVDSSEEEENVEQEEESSSSAQTLNMQVSIWTRAEKKQNDETNKTMVVYLHGNASARIEVVPYLSFLLAQGLFGVASIDFTGSGLSDGEYVSLGYYERFDLECLLQYLGNKYGNGLQVVLWGRSMGASTALMHASRQTQETSTTLKSDESEPVENATTSPVTDMEASKKNTIDRDATSHNNNNTSAASTTILQGLICDSPFASLPQLCQELVYKAREQGIVVPGIVVSAAIALISRSVQNKAQFQISEINPLAHVPTVQVPALFVVGADDDFIPPHHSEDLIQAYAKGQRTNLFMVPGDHNAPRPDMVFLAVETFLQQRLSLSVPLKVPEKIARHLNQNPPWAFRNFSKDIFQVHDANDAVMEAATNDTASEELGMTKKRQEDVQNKIQLMFGKEEASG